MHTFSKMVKLIRYGLAGWLPGGQYFCIACGQRIWKFMPYRRGSRSKPALMQALEIIGSDIDNFECPRCGAHDRERHLLLYLDYSGLFQRMGNSRVLHMAPERHLSKLIATYRPSEYIMGDLCPSSPDIAKLDLMELPFEACTFDFVLANHVLEHVANDYLTLTEVYRVLKPAGYAILQTPFSPILHRTWDDRGITESSVRLQAFGQEDHVRLYGRDIVSRFSASGLVPHISTHTELLPEIDSGVYGVNRAEPFFLFLKPDVEAKKDD